jgi:hypothetical protein
MTGNPLFGFLLLVGIFEVVGWQWAVLFAGLILAEVVLRLMFTTLAASASGVVIGNYNGHAAKAGPRAAALAEASHGAAMIALPILALVQYGGALPPWSALAALAVMVCGGFRLFNGAKFSVGWRDPKLIARAAIKIALAVLLFRAIGARQFGNVDPVVYSALSLLGWWLLVTAATKLFLVLRGFPAAPWEGGEPPMPHGEAPFANPSDAAKGLKG